MNNQLSDEQKKILAKTKRIIDLQFRGYREGKHTSRRTYRSVVHAYARYIITQKGGKEIAINLDDVQSYIDSLIKKGRTVSYANGVICALKYYTRKTHGKDSKVLHQLDRVKVITGEERIEYEKI
ncbi:MAG TPA: hypothetical protein PKU88_09530 [Bacillota bacterium]|nr:hypothetical protein [Bacillota bacterium]